MCYYYVINMLFDYFWWPLCVCGQGQACVLVLRAMQSRDVQQLLGGDQWAELCTKVMSQLVAVS